MDQALGRGPPFRIDPPVVTTGALGASVIEVVFHSGELGLPNLGLTAEALVAVDLDMSLAGDDMAVRRRAARMVSGAARRAASSIMASEARVSIERPRSDSEVGKLAFAHDELADGGLAHRVMVLFEVLMQDDDSTDTIRQRTSGPAAALLIRMADAVHDAVDDPAWVAVFGER